MNKNSYAFFLTKDLANKTVEALGSDGYLPLDGRTSLENQEKTAMQRLKAMNQNLNKGFIGFNLYKGKRLVKTVLA